MRPLLFLTFRSFVNSVKRSLTSVTRLISLVVFVGYYILVFVRPFQRMTPGDIPQGPISFTFPTAAVVDAVLFGMFAFLTLFLALGVFGVKGTFRPADVDVLFPTPVSPRLVLVFRIIRDYLFTLLLPLIFALLMYRPVAPGVFALFQGLQNFDGNKVMRATTVAWLLLALAWVTISYAVSLYINRSDLRSERNKKFLNFGFLGAVVAVGAFIAWRVSGMSGFEDLVPLAQSPILRVFFFTATAATATVMGVMPGGNPLLTVVGATALIALIVSSLLVTMNQAGWMYDQAASRGTDAQTLRTLQRQGDMIGMMAEQARRGKLKASKRRWIQNLSMPGPLALVWKEVIIQMRSSAAALWIFIPLALMMSIMPVVVARVEVRTVGPLFLTMQGVTLFMMVVSVSQSGFIELLRRVDLQKPLPFPSPVIVAAEVSAKILPSVLTSWLAAIVVVVLRPQIWSYSLAAVVLVPFAAMLMASVVFLVTILFPDVDDPMQRGFRGLVTFLGMAMLLVPVGLVMVGLLFIGTFPLIAAVVVAALALGLTAGVCMVAGRLYENYNPSE